MAKQFIKINTDSLGADVNELRELISNSEANLEKMYESVTALDSMWDGPANESFVSQFNSDFTVFREIIALLRDLVDDMDDAKQKYNKCEDEVYSLISSMKI